ncbi:MAG: type II toxin-antitoxin system PemK/MazF family toxin [Verrucomicrobiota bacterium]
MTRGEIWLADLGYTGKVRPVLVLSVNYTDDERAIVTYIPRTTSVWDQGRFDVVHRARGMREGAFAVQLIGSISNAKYMRRISKVDDDTLQKVEQALKLWLGLAS